MEARADTGPRTRVWTLICLSALGQPACSTDPDGPAHEAAAAAGSGGSGDGTAGGGATGGVELPGIGGSTGSGITCLVEACAADEFYDREYDGCYGSYGKCVPRPAECTDVDEPVCACDGSMYPSACAAHLAGVDVSGARVCPPPDRTFYCGDLFCARGAEYCELVNGNATCKPLPESCMAPDADGSCLEPCFAAPGGPSCYTNDAGDFTMVCEVTR